jgi:GTP-binding protein HflX
MFDILEKPRRVVLVGVQLPSVPDDEFRDSMAELGHLAETLGHEVAATVTQRRATFDPGAYVGAGKLEELRLLVQDGADLLVLDDEVTPSQARNLEKATEADVLDRTAVILEIFHRHARTRAARLQVEMVRLRYMAPRLRELGKGNKDRQRRGTGGRGAGESQMELDRRKIRDRIAEIKDQIASMDEERHTQSARRAGLSRVAIVGYTNAGKSTLMRALTGSDVLVADKLFATLDTTVRHLTPAAHPPILVSDTVGFIKNLPHGLVASFKSTLEEAREASLLLQVVDVSDSAYERQMEVTARVLGEIGAAQVPRFLALNKIDRLGDAAAQADAEARLCARWPEALVLSAKRAADVARLHATIVAFFEKELVEEHLVVPYDRQELRGAIYADCSVVEERYEEGGVVFRVRGHPRVFAALRERLHR